MDDAVITEAPGGNHAVRFERKFAQPPAEVWAALTQGPRLGQWFAPGTIEPKPGGQVRLAFTTSPTVIESTVTALTPGTLIEYHWITGGVDGGPIRFELAPDGTGTRLVLTHTMPLAMRRPSTLAAWHMHLEQLAGALAGRPIPWSNERWQALRGIYAQQLG